MKSEILLFHFVRISPSFRLTENIGVAAYGVVANLSLVVISIYTGIAQGAQPIVSIFNSEQNIPLQQIAETGLKIYFTAIPFVGYNIIICSYFTSTEKALPAQIISLSRGFLVIIPMAFFLSFLLRMTGVWLSFPITECFVTLAGIALYIKFRKR